jgi:hypothetical protein
MAIVAGCAKKRIALFGSSILVASCGGATGAVVAPVVGGGSVLVLFVAAVVVFFVGTIGGGVDVGVAASLVYVTP